MEGVLASVRQYILEKVNEGFYSREEITEDAEEYVNDEFERDDLDSIIEVTVDELLEAHSRLQETWNQPTDCDKLDIAFATLDADGIVARQNFEDCLNCGLAMIWGEIDKAKEQHQVEGYVFYHWQDTERAARGEGLFLAFGSVVEDESRLVQTGWRIVQAIHQAGLEVDWTGSPNNRLLVRMDWKRRRV